MIQQNDLTIVICSVGVLIFISSYRRVLWRVPDSRLLISAYSLLVAAWTLTILKELFWAATLNLLEHLCYAASAIILNLWLFRLPDTGDRA